MKVKAITVRRKVNILKQPQPKFVSLVDYGANQTPFQVVKRHDGVITMKKPRKGAAPAAKRRVPVPAKKTASKKPVKKEAQSPDLASGVLKLVFSKDRFPTQKAVEAYLSKNKWEDYQIDEDNTDFIVSSTELDSSDLTNIREVELDRKGVTAYVGRIKETSEKAVKPRQTEANAGDDSDEDAENAENANADQSPEDEDDKDDADADADADDGEGDDDGDDDGDSDADADDADDSGDEGADDADDGDDDAEDEDEDDSDDEDGEGDDDDASLTEEELEEQDEEAGEDADEADATAALDQIESQPKNKPYSKRPGADGLSIDDREADEPDEETLPGQGLSPRGPGADKSDSGNAGGVGSQTSAKSAKRPLTKAERASIAKSVKGKKPVRKTRHSNPVIDAHIRKFDNYGVYLSGGMSLKEVLEDGLGDGVPPGIDEIFNGMYKSLGNALKNSDNIPAAINKIAAEFSETVLAVHDVWSELLKSGTKSQKAAARKYFASTPDLQMSASADVGAVTKANIQSAVKAAIAPLQKTITEQGELIAKLKKGVPARRSLGNDDVTAQPTAEAQRKEAARKQREEDDEFMSSLTYRALTGNTLPRL